MFYSLIILHDTDKKNSNKMKLKGRERSHTVLADDSYLLRSLRLWEMRNNW